MEVTDGKVSAVALDGFRLALVTTEISNAGKDINFIVPAKSLKEISNLLNDSDENVKINIQNNFMMVEI